MSGDTRDVRPHDQLDRSALARYLRWHLAGQQIAGLQLDADFHVSKLSSGDSHLTYLLRLGGAEFVLRRPGTAALTSATDAMSREFGWLSALHPVFPLAPKAFLLCDDDSVIGGPFSVVERRRGMVVRANEPVTLAGHPQVRRQLSDAVIDVLVSLHAVDVDEPLLALDARAGFVDRLVREWTGQWHTARTEIVVDMDAVALWLAAHQPAAALEPSVVHGNFTLESLLLDPLNPAEITAVLDWETAAVGDPLWDVGVLLARWGATPGDAGHDALSTVTAGDGYLTREALIARYAERSGRDLADIAFYETLALFRLGVICQQQHTPSSAGAASITVSPDEQVRGLARRARALAG